MLLCSVVHEGTTRAQFLSTHMFLMNSELNAPPFAAAERDSEHH